MNQKRIDEITKALEQKDRTHDKYVRAIARHAAQEWDTREARKAFLQTQDILRRRERSLTNPEERASLQIRGQVEVREERVKDLRKEHCQIGEAYGRAVILLAELDDFRKKARSAYKWACQHLERLVPEEEKEVN